MIRFDMEYIEEEHTVYLKDYGTWEEKIVELHNDRLSDKLVYAMETAFRNRYRIPGDDELHTPAVKLIFTHEPPKVTCEALARSKVVFDERNYVFEWKYCPQEDSGQKDTDTKSPDDQ